MKQPEEEKKENPILTVEEGEDQNGTSFLVVGLEKYSFDDAGCIRMRVGSIPRVTLKSLLKHLKEIVIQTGIEPYEDEDLEAMPWLNWTSVKIKDAGNAELTVDGKIDSDHVLSVVEAGVYVEMLELSAKNHSEFGKSVRFREYGGMAGASFELKVKLKAKMFDDVVSAGMKIVNEIFRPVRESEKFVEGMLNRLKSPQKK